MDSTEKIAAKPIIVTTSWDDGHPADLKIAELLHSRGLPGTFYVPIHNGGKPTLGAADIRSLRCERFEIGGHGLSHQTLTDLPTEEVREEATACMRILEDIVGGEVRSFCYPKGRYDLNVQNSVRLAGYRGARTTKMLAVELDFGAFEMPTTLQAYRHDRLAYVRNLAKRGQFCSLSKYVTQFSNLPSWVAIGKKLFDSVLRDGGLWHLYGHSWEIEAENLWEELREMLDYVSRRDRVLYLTNGDVLDLLFVAKQKFATINSKYPKIYT
jgi:peptidoglycan-N-acetylglucosamine deacetylase